MFKDSFSDISILLKNLYDEEKSILKKPSDKKEVKYYSKELIPFLVNTIAYSHENNIENELSNFISSFYKKYFSDSGLITSFPDAPPLDSTERYANLSLKSEDLLDEAMFRIINSPSPNLSGLASIFTKSITYSTKKNTLTNSSTSFDSSINMFLIFIILHTLTKYKNEKTNNSIAKIIESTNCKEAKAYRSNDYISEIYDLKD